MIFEMDMLEICECNENCICARCLRVYSKYAELGDDLEFYQAENEKCLIQLRQSATVAANYPSLIPRFLALL